jgi:hypothetical protein
LIGYGGIFNMSTDQKYEELEKEYQPLKDRFKG